MIVNNEFTSPEQRFFYPEKNPVEYHESLDTDGLPSVIKLDTGASKVVIKTQDGHAYSPPLFKDSFDIPYRAVMRRVQCQPANDREMAAGAAERVYDLHQQIGTLAIVQVDMDSINNADRLPSSRQATFDTYGTALVPADQPLPWIKNTKPKEKSPSANHYQLLGLISPDDELVTWGPRANYSQRLIDWCVANSLTQNRLEAALLDEALPNGGDLPSILRGHFAASTYLQYFDEKYRTNYTPTVDPRTHDLSQFPLWLSQERATFHRLVNQAQWFATNPR